MSNIQPTEEFRPVPGFPKYEVSNLGRVRSLARKSPSYLKPLPVGGGYLTVILTGQQRRYIHRLVLEAFVGPCPPEMEARHVERNDKTDNRLDNLTWGTKLENAADRKGHGTHLFGEAANPAKLSDEAVLEMRRLRGQGASREELAVRFGVNVTNVSRAVLGVHYSHLELSDEERARLKQAGYARGDRHHAVKRMKARQANGADPEQAG
jgi:hypothetical protein